MKNRRSKTRRNSRYEADEHETSSWFWMAVGFLPGLLIAAVVYFSHSEPQGVNPYHVKRNAPHNVSVAKKPGATKKNTPVVKKVAKRVQKKKAPRPVIRVNKTGANRKTARATKPGARKTVAGNKSGQNVEYTFFSTLPKEEVIVSDREIDQAARRNKQTEKKKGKQRKVLLRKRKALAKKKAAENKRKALLRKRKALAKKKAAEKKRKALLRKRKALAKKKAAENKRKNRKQPKKPTTTQLAKKKKTSKNKTKTNTKLANTDSNKGANRYLLQAGSFKLKKQAESHKAKLALLGVISHIEKVKINGDLWYRVRVGPFKSYKEIRVNLKRLRKNNINVIPVRLQAKK
jgi:cell division protein FtsN